MSASPSRSVIRLNVTRATASVATSPAATADSLASSASALASSSSDREGDGGHGREGLGPLGRHRKFARGLERPTGGGHCEDVVTYPRQLVRQPRGRVNPQRRLDGPIDGLGGRFEQLDGPQPVAGRAGRVRCLHLQRQFAGPGALGGVGDGAPPLQGPVQMSVGLARRVDRLGVCRRVDRRRQRQTQIVTAFGVVGDLGRHRRIDFAAGLEDLGVLGVHADPLAGQQVLVGRLLQQGVSELVCAGLGRHQDVPGHRVAQGVVQGAARPARRPRPAGRGHPAAGDGGDPDDPLGVRPEQVEPGDQDVGQPGRQPSAAGHGQTRLEQFLGEEGVSLGAVDDVAHHARGGGRAAGAGGQRVDQRARCPRRPTVAASSGGPGGAG